MFIFGSSSAGFMRVCLLLLLFCLSLSVQAQIRVSPTHRYLTTEDGKPFFWLGDTAWELFHRLSREEAVQYLDVRQKQGFNVIQAVALAELNGLKQPNFYGDVPFENLDPTRWAQTPGQNPNDAAAYDYWDHVDFIVQEAAKRGLYVALLPTWGDKVVVSGWGDGPKVFDEKNAYTYVRALAQHFKNQPNIIWMLGGDRPAVYDRKVGETEQHFDDRPVWRAMARGIQDVYGKDVFICYHPDGSANGTAKYLHQEPWLAMNAVQSGHGSRTAPIWTYIRRDWALQPPKPVIDLEPCYEDHPVNPWDGKWTRQGRGYFSAYDVRARMYRGVFAGGCGTTYGHHQIWQFLDKTRNPPIFVGDTLIGWRQALQAKAAYQMQYLKQLMESKKDFDRVEDSLLVTSARGSDYRDLIISTRNQTRTYALIYLPQPKPVSVDLGRLKAGKKRASWFEPATGRSRTISGSYTSGVVTFTPPASAEKEQDWVLVLDVL